jgi:hypothetical protein
LFFQRDLREQQKMGNCLGISSEKQSHSDSKETVRRMMDAISGERPRWPSLMACHDIGNEHAPTSTASLQGVQQRTLECKHKVKPYKSKSSVGMISQEWLCQSRAAAEAQKQDIANKIRQTTQDLYDVERPYEEPEPGSMEMTTRMIEDGRVNESDDRLIPTNHHERRYSSPATNGSNSEHDASAESTSASLDYAGQDEAELSHDETHVLNGSPADMRGPPCEPATAQDPPSPPHPPPFLERANSALRTILSGGARPPSGPALGRRPAKQGAPPRRRRAARGAEAAK